MADFDWFNGLVVHLSYETAFLRHLQGSIIYGYHLFLTKFRPKEYHKKPKNTEKKKLKNRKCGKICVLSVHLIEEKRSCNLDKILFMEHKDSCRVPNLLHAFEDTSWKFSDIAALAPRVFLIFTQYFHLIED